MSEPSTKLGKRLFALMSYDVKLTDWDRAAADFANEIRGEAIPWAHKALDFACAPRGPDIAGRIRALAVETEESRDDIRRARQQCDRAVKSVEDANKALDDVGAPKGQDIVGRIRELGGMVNKHFMQSRVYEEQCDNVRAALNEVGAKFGVEPAERIRALATALFASNDDVTHAHGDMTWAGVPQAGTLGERVRWLINERTRLLGAEREAGRKTGLTENALNACKAFDAPTDPSDAVVYLATLLDEGDAVRKELRDIIVEAIKGEP